MRRMFAIWVLVVGLVGAGASALSAQGVTTGSMSGRVTGMEGVPMADVRVNAVHRPSGTRYQGVSRNDGRFTIPGMRVGGPYTVTARAIGYSPEVQDGIILNLGVATDLVFALKRRAVELGAVTVTAQTGTLSSTRTGAATAVSRDVLETLPTISRTINDFTRLTPQASGSSFAGQDTRLNNITVDGSYFNNSFGLSGQPGGRTGVAPIPLDAVEQIQVNIAPYDVRQGNFVGAGVNAVTKSGTNDWQGSLYYLSRNQNYAGTRAGGVQFDPGTFKFHQVGARLGGPILRDKLFFFANYENDALAEPGTTFLSNTGGQPNTGSVTRVLDSDVQALSTYLSTNFKYDTGPYNGYSNETPSSRLITKLDFNANDHNKLSLRYISLDSKSDVLSSNSSSLGAGNRRSNNDALSYQSSNYAINENIRSLVGEVNSQFGSNVSNNMIVGYTTNDESREGRGAFFPLVDILQNGKTYLSFGTEAFTPNNQLRYNTFQFQNNLSFYTTSHDFTVGVTAQRYRSENVFFPGSQSVYVYNSLSDFYADANGYLASPTRTSAPVTLNKFQVRYNNIPGQVEPVQPLEVMYSGAYAQDEWRATDRLKVTAGVRVDVPRFKNTALANSDVDLLTFRDENGAAVKYSTSKMPGANMLFSPRLGFNWDAKGDRTTQIRGGTGVFTGSPAYVWISNQVGANGLLTGFSEVLKTTTRPFNPSPDAYKPTTVTGAPAASYELAFTDPDYKFPQVWRSNFAVDQSLPYGFIGTAEVLYAKDVNGTYYINANLPAANGAFTGPDARPLWTTPAATRINPQITSAIVLKNQSVGYSYNLAGSLEKSFSNGFFAKGAYSYGVSRNTVDPGSIALGSWGQNEQSGDPNNPGVGYSGNSARHRGFVALSYRQQYFDFGATSFSLFAEGRTFGNTSYTFSGDMNGDGQRGNDLIYIPRDASEMRFEAYTPTGSTRLFTVADQNAAWEAYINQDEYLRSHRGQYAERGAVFLPVVYRADFSVTQDIYARAQGKRNNLQLRMDVLNFGNLLNNKWGTGQRLVSNQPLISRGANGAGEAIYRLQNVGNELLSTTFQKTAGIGDVYRIQLGLRYTFD